MDQAKEKHPGGRPTKFKPEYVKQVEKLCRLGATDAQLADFFEVNVDTIHEWKKVHPEFSDSLKKGKLIADSEVADSLYNRALGYTHDEDKIFNHEGVALVVPTKKHYPPDTVACIFWLKNRQPDLWREKVDIVSDGKALNQGQTIIQLPGGKEVTA